MQLALPGSPHLTYCTNIHAGETWGEIEDALHRILPGVKQSIAPDRAMGVGLRLSAIAADELATDSAAMARLRAFLADGGFYVFTVNAFPFGRFHGQRVKEQVYEPDWRTQERLAFTMRVADILGELVPEGLESSISTVPGGFRPNISSVQDIDHVRAALVQCAAHLYRIRSATGRSIVLALEPEPACFLETTQEAIGYFTEHLFAHRSQADFASRVGISIEAASAALRHHLGLCFDVCHSAVAFEDVDATLADVEAAGIRIAKIQLSAALKVVSVSPANAQTLLAFDDGVYLHQTVESRDGVLTRYTDLPEALIPLRGGDAGGEWRIHCHVPVFVDRFNDLQSTQENLRQVLARCRARAVSPHLEVETYTWSVLPSELRHADIGGDIARELAWVRAELGA